MLKRLLLVFIIGVGIVFVPYWIGSILLNDESDKTGLWCVGLGALMIPFCLYILIRYRKWFIRGLSICLLLLVGMGVKGQDYKEGRWVMINVDDYQKMKDSIKTLQHKNDSLQLFINKTLAYFKIDLTGKQLTERTVYDPCNPDSTHGRNMWHMEVGGWRIRIDERGAYARWNDSGKWLYIGNYVTQWEHGDAYIFDIPKTCPNALNHIVKIKHK